MNCKYSSVCNSRHALPPLSAPGVLFRLWACLLHCIIHIAQSLFALCTIVQPCVFHCSVFNCCLQSPNSLQSFTDALPTQCLPVNLLPHTPGGWHQSSFLHILLPLRVEYLQNWKSMPTFCPTPVGWLWASQSQLAPLCWVKPSPL